MTGLLKNNGQNFFALKAANAQNGVLATTYSGSEPQAPGYSPMHQEGAIVLGTGGDNSNASIGSFFEGVMTAGVSSDEADDKVQADIVASGYGGPTGLAGRLKPGSEISLQSMSPFYDNSFLAHGGSDSNATTIVPISPASAAATLADATWIVRRGLADGLCLSFEARNYPGDYLVQSNFALTRGPDNGTTIFRLGSTFCSVPGNDGQGHSFQSIVSANLFIRDFAQMGYVASDEGPDAWDTTVGFGNDTSWIVSAPLAP